VKRGDDGLAFCSLAGNDDAGNWPPAAAGAKRSPAWIRSFDTMRGEISSSCRQNAITTAWPMIPSVFCPGPLCCQRSLLSLSGRVHSTLPLRVAADANSCGTAAIRKSIRRQSFPETHQARAESGPPPITGTIRHISVCGLCLRSRQTHFHEMLSPVWQTSSGPIHRLGRVQLPISNEQPCPFHVESLWSSAEQPLE
jgi:hypothetical protein